MSAARPITGSSPPWTASASSAVHSFPSPACGRRMNRPAVRPAHKNFLSDTWRPETNDCSCRPAQTHLGDQMSFDHQHSSSSAKPGSVQQSHGSHQLSAHTVVAQSHSQSPLVPCVYIALLCSHCGELRQALAALPNTEIAVCPECSRACAFVLLGSGLTRRVLPFHELRPAPQTPWDHGSDESDDDS